MKKKLLIFVCIISVVLATVGLIYASSVLNKEKEEKESHLVLIDFKTLEKKIKNKETFILVLTQEHCSHCMAYKPILKETLYEYDVYAYELDIEKLSEKEAGKLKDIANASGTPATIFIRDGQEISTKVRLMGAKTKTEIVSRLKSLGYIS